MERSHGGEGVEGKCRSSMIDKRQNVWPDLGPNCFATLIAFLKEFFKKVEFEKKQQTTKSEKNCTWDRVYKEISKKDLT